MLTNEDIEKLKTALTTKDDLKELKGGFDIFRDEVSQNFNKMVTLEEFDGFKSEIKQDMDGLREMVQSLVTAVDKLVKAVTDLRAEYAAVAH